MTQFLVGFAIYWGLGLAITLAAARWHPDGNLRAVLANRSPGYIAGFLLTRSLLILPQLLLVGFGCAAQWFLGIEKPVEEAAKEEPAPPRKPEPPPNVEIRTPWFRESQQRPVRKPN